MGLDLIRVGRFGRANGFGLTLPLVVRFFTGQVLSMEAIARTFKLLLHTKKGFEVRDMGDH